MKKQDLNAHGGGRLGKTSRISGTWRIQHGRKICASYVHVRYCTLPAPGREPIISFFTLLSHRVPGYPPAPSLAFSVDYHSGQNLLKNILASNGIVIAT